MLSCLSVLLSSQGAHGVSLRAAVAVSSSQQQEQHEQAAQQQQGDGDTVFLRVDPAFNGDMSGFSRIADPWCGSFCAKLMQVEVESSLFASTLSPLSPSKVLGAGRAESSDVCWSRQVVAGDSFFLKASVGDANLSLTASFFVLRPCGGAGCASPYMQVTLGRAQVTSSKLSSSGKLSVCLRAGEVSARLKAIGRDGSPLKSNSDDFGWSFIENRAQSASAGQLVI